MTKSATLTAAALFICSGLISLSADGVASPAGPFLCIVDRATGFVFDPQTSSWRSANFSGGGKFILRRNDTKLYEVVPGTRMPVSGIWAVWEFGDNHWPAFTCSADFSKYGGLWCESSLGARFGVNVTNGRFISESMLGYIQAGMSGYLGVDGKPLPEGSNTPSISIGKCAAL